MVTNRVHQRRILTNVTGDCSLLMLVRTLAREGETIVTSHLKSVLATGTGRHWSTRETGASSAILPASHTSHRESTSLIKEVLRPIQVPTMAAWIPILRPTTFLRALVDVVAVQPEAAHPLVKVRAVADRMADSQAQMGLDHPRLSDHPLPALLRLAVDVATSILGMLRPHPRAAPEACMRRGSNKTSPEWICHLRQLMPRPSVELIQTGYHT
jgi:hypothetical protein